MPPKRKRAATVSKDDERPKASAPEPVQASSRDASGEDNTADPALDDVRDRKSMDPPAKRTRGASSTSTTPSKRAPPPPAIDTKQAGNSSSSRTPKKKPVAMPIDSAIHGSGEHGEAGTLRMDAPPPAGSVDPVGYHTNPPPTDRPVRVYADGVFDLFHLGHMRQLQQAKTAFPEVHLMVGVTGDKETHTRKGLTVMSGKERAESLRHCRWVDEVIEDCPWIISPEFLERHDIDYVAHDDIPYGANEGDDIYKPIKEEGKFLVTQRTEGVSTTAIITKIVRDYEQYISRQLKRGTSRQELNVSWLKKNELELKRHVAELREQIRSNWLNTGQELSREFRSFWDRSRPGSPAPSRAGSLLNGGGSSSGRNQQQRRGDGPRSPLSPTAGSVSGSTRGNGGSSSTRGRGSNTDFAAGYAMGLIGGVRGWMEGSRRRNLSDSRPQSPEESGDNSPVEEEEGGQARRKSSVDDEGNERVVDVLHS